MTLKFILVFGVHDHTEIRNLHHFTTQQHRTHIAQDLEDCVI